MGIERAKARTPSAELLLATGLVVARAAAVVGLVDLAAVGWHGVDSRPRVTANVRTMLRKIRPAFKRTGPAKVRRSLLCSDEPPASHPRFKTLGATRAGAFVGRAAIKCRQDANPYEVRIPPAAMLNERVELPAGANPRQTHLRITLHALEGIDPAHARRGSNPQPAEPKSAALSD